MRVAECQIAFIGRRFRKALVLSGGVIEIITEARATVTVENDTGHRATGTGNVFLSYVWAWPGSTLGYEQCDAAMRALCEDVAAALPKIGNAPMHPLFHGMALSAEVDGIAERTSRRIGLSEGEGIPRLARMVCASPFDAAMHDAYGRLQGMSSYECLGKEYVGHDLSAWLGPIGCGHYLDEFIYPRHWKTLDAWLVVGPNDALYEEGAEEIGDGLPDSIQGWVERHGYRALKLKTKGNDAHGEAEWVAGVYRAVRDIRACAGMDERVRYLVDPNEGCADAGAMVEFLEELRRIDGEAYAALEYIEQPTGRDLGAYDFDMKEIAAMKPVLIDEALQDLRMLDVAAEQGWSGIAAKTCKGHSSTLLEIAWASLTGHMYTLQDLTNPGIGAVHSAGLAAHCDTANGVEVNSMQYAPAANEGIAERFPGIFDVRDGVHRLDELGAEGLLY